MIIELLRQCIKFLLKKDGLDPNSYGEIWTGILSWENMIEGDDQKYHSYEFSGADYFRPVDSDILALFSKCRNICMQAKDKVSTFSRLLTEFFTRVYKKSLWKSYAEYNIFFSFLSDYEKKKLYNLILTKKKSDVIDQYGYFKDEWEEKFNQFGLKNVLWVNADSKLKGLNPDNTCILFKDTTLNYRTVSLSQDIQVEQRMSFFYIYYEEMYPGEKIDTDGLKAFIHEQFKDFL